MQTLVAESLDAGAMGFSTGLIYAPGNYARLEEVIDLAAVAAARGKLYSTHMRDEGSHNVGLFVALNEAPETPKYDLKSVKACISGAAPLPRAVAEKFREVTGGAHLVEGYGLTETSPVTHVNPFDEPKHGTIGLPSPDT